MTEPKIDISFPKVDTSNMLTNDEYKAYVESVLKAPLKEKYANIQKSIENLELSISKCNELLECEDCKEEIINPIIEAIKLIKRVDEILSEEGSCYYPSI